MEPETEHRYIVELTRGWYKRMLGKRPRILVELSSAGLRGLIF